MTTEKAEPVAWRWRCCVGGVWGSWRMLDVEVEQFLNGAWSFNLDNGSAELEPLYAASAHRYDAQSAKALDLFLRDIISIAKDANATDALGDIIRRAEEELTR